MKLRAITFFAGSFLFEDAMASGIFERIELEMEVLIFC